jgi:hypothetical protein
VIHISGNFRHGGDAIGSAQGWQSEGFRCWNPVRCEGGLSGVTTRWPWRQGRSSGLAPPTAT